MRDRLIEFGEEQSNTEQFVIASGQEYRVNGPKYTKNVKREICLDDYC